MSRPGLARRARRGVGRGDRRGRAGRRPRPLDPAGAGLGFGASAGGSALRRLPGTSRAAGGAPASYAAEPLQLVVSLDGQVGPGRAPVDLSSSADGPQMLGGGGRRRWPAAWARAGVSPVAWPGLAARAEVGGGPQGSKMLAGSDRGARPPGAWAARARSDQRPISQSDPWGVRRSPSTTSLGAGQSRPPRPRHRADGRGPTTARPGASGGRGAALDPSRRGRPGGSGRPPGRRAAMERGPGADAPDTTRSDRRRTCPMSSGTAGDSRRFRRSVAAREGGGTGRRSGRSRSGRSPGSWRFLDVGRERGTFSRPSPLHSGRRSARSHAIRREGRIPLDDRAGEGDGLAEDRRFAALVSGWGRAGAPTLPVASTGSARA